MLRNPKLGQRVHINVRLAWFTGDLDPANKAGWPHVPRQTERQARGGTLVFEPVTTGTVRGIIRSRGESRARYVNGRYVGGGGSVRTLVDVEPDWPAEPQVDPHGQPRLWRFPLSLLRENKEP